MAHFIDKDALIAEIEKFKENANKRGAIGKVSTIVLCNELLSFLDTLDELQECDFDTAIERYIGQHRGELRGYFDIRRIARYFYELGRLTGYVSINKKKKYD